MTFGVTTVVVFVFGVVTGGITGRHLKDSLPISWEILGVFFESFYEVCVLGDGEGWGLEMGRELRELWFELTLPAALMP